MILIIWWMIDVRHRFKGPHTQGSMAELNAIEQQIGEKLIISEEEEPAVQARLENGLALFLNDNSPASIKP